MALRVDYIAKETGNNLVRNPSLTIATVLTVAVSLALLGAALVIQRGVDGLNTRFKDDVEFIVWLAPDATGEQRESVERALADSPQVRDWRFVNIEETYAEFEEFWQDSPEVLEAVTPEQLPTSFRVVPEIPDLAVVQSLGSEFEGLPGVRNVDYAGEYIKRLNDFTRVASNIMLGAALASAAASAMLMYNSIRTALFARRREIEVMRLVGATNWFIRIPFMLEGLVQGVVGAAVSTVAVFGLNRVIRNLLNSTSFRLFDSFALDSAQLFPVAMTLLGAGALIGFVGSGIAVTRYLDA
ncbi:MAG: cell division transport system permease protein [Acidimicrobiales bacterium]|jgi:cell division transport system permease protein